MESRYHWIVNSFFHSRKPVVLDGAHDLLAQFRALCFIPKEVILPSTAVKQIDATTLTAEDVEKLDHDALKEALRSVIRNPTSSMMHQDHRSHSSSSERPIERPAELTAVGKREIAAPAKKTLEPVVKTAPPVEK